MQSNNYVVIMAGGIGSRFWPASRTEKPKQFLDILGMGKSLIRLTFERFLNIVPASNIYVVTHKDYGDLVQKELPEIGSHQVLLEPARKNTAPCIAYAAFKIAAASANANLIVAPSDHLIMKEEAFLRKLQQGLDFVTQEDALLTLGIQPTHPNTGYGYIHFEKNQDKGGIAKVKQFTEKPNLEKAKAFVEGAAHLWNAGIFVWSNQYLLNSFQQYTPELYQSFVSVGDVWNRPEEQQAIEQIYSEVESISIDYALMEKASSIYTLAADIGWSDIGTWGALHKVLDKDEDENAQLSSTQQKIILKDTQNCLVKVAKEKLVILGGLSDYIVVDEEDVLLVYPKSKEQEIKQLKGEVEATFKEEYS